VTVSEKKPEMDFPGGLKVKPIGMATVKDDGGGGGGAGGWERKKLRRSGTGRRHGRVGHHLPPGSTCCYQ